MSTNTLICLANDLDFVFRVDTSTIHQKSSPDDEVMMRLDWWRGLNIYSFKC